MATFLRKARRRALARRWQRDSGRLAPPSALREVVSVGPPHLDLDQENGCEIDPTPTPRPVTVDLWASPDAEPTRPALGRFAPHGHATRRRRFAVAIAAMALFVVAALLWKGAPRADAGLSARAFDLKQILAAPALHRLEADPEPLPVPVAAPAPPRADARLHREGYGHIPGGVLFVPRTFASADGRYDLYLHFHGNTRVVLESAEHAGLDAIVAVVNLGVNSAPYLDAYAVPGSLEALLDSIDRAVAERGLASPRLRRLAVGSWSGGYGAVSRVLELGRESREKLDAVLVLDGIHCGYLEEDPRALNVRIISPFLYAVKHAAAGQMLFSITHSEIEPAGYAGTQRTAGYLLDVVRASRGAPGIAPEHVQIRAAEGAVSKKLEKRMEPLSETVVGTFRVRGYRGNTPEHHMAHLLQMGATVMPELVERWSARR